MRRSIVLCATVSLLVSCDTSSESSKSTPPAPGAPASGASADAKAPAASTAKATADDALGQLKSGTAKAAEAVKETVATAKENTDAAAKAPASKATDAARDTAAMADSGFSVEKLKGMLGSMNADSLKGLAEKLLDALQGKTDLVKSIQDQVAKLGAADSTKGADLKKQLDGLAPAISGLKGKLKVVVDKLKESGIDVSKYTSVLGGQ